MSLGTSKAKCKNLNRKYPPLAQVLNVWSLTTWGLDTSGGRTSWRKKVTWGGMTGITLSLPISCLSFCLLVCCDMNSLYHMPLPPWSEVFPHAVPRWTKILWNHEPKITEVVSIRYHGNSNTKVTKAPSSSVFYTCSNELKAALTDTSAIYWALHWVTKFSSKATLT